MLGDNLGCFSLGDTALLYRTSRDSQWRTADVEQMSEGQVRQKTA